MKTLFTAPPTQSDPLRMAMKSAGMSAGVFLGTTLAAWAQPD
jgi:hypothetical protein